MNRFSRLAGLFSFYAGILFYSPIEVFSAVDGTLTSPSSECEAKPKTTKPKITTCRTQCRQSNCCCPPIVYINRDATSAQGDQQVEERRNSASSREVEKIAKIAEMTLKDVNEHTDFLKDLWTWTTIIGSILIGSLAVYGFRTIHDINKWKEGARRSVKQYKTTLRRLTQDANNNHLVMMYTTRADVFIERIMELEERQSKTDHLEDYEKQAIQVYLHSIKEDLGKALRDQKSTDRKVRGWAYNLYGYALYRLGDFSQALEALKESIKLDVNNGSALYNAACCAARLRLTEMSAEFLKRAVQRDYTFLAKADDDPDFSEIRKSPEFVSFLGKKNST